MGIKLDRCKRWLPAKNYLKDQHDISVPFSNLHYNYYSAWEYVTKEDDRSYKAKIIPIYGIPNLLAKTNVVSSLKKSRPNREPGTFTDSSGMTTTL